MNYNSVVTVVLLLLTWIGWAASRKGVFRGPNIDRNRLDITRRRRLREDDVDERTPLL
ncbi:uncharacterized protein CTRU02_214235 [Colletotrichum truncatum]|uniref:Uncharacterized protein n=1 Tax=Colletotrichum truncatum TaxID=5467 RepID=A0ACC3YI09_COLTU